MNEQDLKNLRIVLQEELQPIKHDLAEIIKQSQRRLSKDIARNLGQYHDKLENYVDSRTEALNKRVFPPESEMEQIERKLN